MDLQMLEMDGVAVTVAIRAEWSNARPNLHRAGQNQLEWGVRRPKRRYHRGQRENLAGQLYAVRPGLLRP
jgi:hypothetical protein